VKAGQERSPRDMADSPIRKKNAKPAANDQGSSYILSVSDIKELFRLMRENEIAELQIEQQETKIHIVSKGAHNAPPAQMVPVMTGVPQMGMMPVSAAHPQQLAAPVQSGSEAAGATEPPATEAGANAPANMLTVYSPMVGTFYSSPAPDAPPFVRIGESVNDDTVLCIIEAMKIMNEIKAETKGRIYKMLVENGSPVEYNQPLFLIEP
jgi:acetyl-CoA carboxylase biotin carboxyl carrier protein